MTSPEEAHRGRGRPRSPEAEAKVLTAALVEYGERGWAGFTIDGVARRAGVGKSTIYLRWPDKDTLLTDAVASSGVHLTAVDTGTFEGDLVGLATNLLRHFHTPAGWAAIRITVDAASVDERLGAFAARVGELHGRQVEQLCARAAERGEIDPDFPADLVTEAMYGATLTNALLERMEGRTDSDDYLCQRAAHLARMVLRGCGLVDPLALPQHD